MRPARTGSTATLAAGTLLAGTLDLLFASGFWYLRAGVPPVRILQSIARGLLGDASFSGGAATAALGGVLHYLIMSAMFATYYFAAKAWPRLRGRTLAYGVAYGLALYAVMTYVVVPLSAAGGGSHERAWVLASIAMHALIGVLCAVFARRALR